jgi:hypothetical protein
MPIIRKKVVTKVVRIIKIHIILIHKKHYYNTIMVIKTTKLLKQMKHEKLLNVIIN